MTLQGTSSTRSPERQRGLKDCLDCYAACLDLVNYCLVRGGAYAEGAQLRLLLDCAAMCQTTADFILRGSDCYAPVCACCAEICERCAESCLRLHDAMMQACAEVCLRCARSCQELSQREAGAPDVVQEASEESFPASDAPSWTPTASIGGPGASSSRVPFQGG